MEKETERDHIKLPEQKCPKCDYPMDCATAAFTEDTPQPRKGDYTICLSCGTMLVFTDSNGGIRLPNLKEKEAMNKRYDITLLRLAQADIVGDKIKERRERESGSGNPQ
jgi:ferredoxin-like protein FixX